MQVVLREMFAGQDRFSQLVQDTMENSRQRNDRQRKRDIWADTSRNGRERATKPTEDQTATYGPWTS